MRGLGSFDVASKSNVRCQKKREECCISSKVEACYENYVPKPKATIAYLREVEAIGLGGRRSRPHAKLT